MTSSRFYLPQLDGLRFLAFLSVFLAHYLAGTARFGDWGMAVNAGAFGVDLFFVLSSFLITSLLLREKQLLGRIHIGQFWIRRALRIWPLYFFIVLIASAIEPPGLSYVVGFLLFLGNWVLVLGWPHAPIYITAGLWSVGVEEQFYLAWPLILHCVSRRGLRLVCGSMLVFAMGTRAVILVSGNPSTTVIWCNTLARLDPLAVGAIVALLVVHRPVRISPTMRTAVLVATAVIVTALQRRFVFFRPPEVSDTWTYLIVALVLGAAVYATVRAPAGLLGHRGLVYLGRISYGLYVFHFAALRLAHALDISWWGYRLPMAAALTVGLAALSYHFLEKPFLRLKERFTYVPSAPV